MNNLEKKSLLKKENIDPANYFQSILQEAYRLNLLTESELEKIQLQCIQLLAKCTERYTCGDSSSVKVETAQSIAQSIFFTIGIYLKSFQDADLSIVALKEKPLSEQFQHGKKLMETQLNSARQLLEAVQKNSIVTDNQAYNDTIQGIPLFFSSYDIHFGAHNTHGSIDYPLANDKMDLVGVEYIYSYLQKLFFENQFCKYFTDHDINSLLRGYNEQYQDLLINIFTLVLTNLVGSLLANNTLQLNIEPSDREALQKKLTKLSKNQLNILLQNASIELCQKLNIADKVFQKYITDTLINLSGMLKNALVNNQLESIFITLKESHPGPELQFEDGAKMDDELFRSITNEIRECRYVSDKIAIIKREIHSITDLADILEGYCLFDDEFAEVFKSLGDTELALLSKKLPTHIIDSGYLFTENQKEWHNRLRIFLEDIPSDRRERINELSEKIGMA